MRSPPPGNGRAPGRDDLARVLHYLEHWLELSAGFVHEQVRRSSHHGLVVSHNATEHRDAFPYRPVWRLDRLHRWLPERRWPATLTNALTAIAMLHRSQLVHVHLGYVIGDVVPFVKRRDLPLVLSLHGEDATALPVRQPGHYDEAVDAVDAVIVPSQFFARIARSLGFGDERVHVIPSGIDTSYFTPTPLPDRPVVTFVGRLVEKKGVDILLRAWPTVVARVPGARLDILGDGRLAHLIPVGDQSVRHVAPQPQRRRAQVRHLIRGARVVVSPSRTAASGDMESLLLVNLEAQASGRPVVTTRNGGIPEFVVADESALVVNEDDADALADALVTVLTDEALAQRLGAAGPQVAAGFDVHARVEAVDNLYDTLLRNRRGR